MSLGYFLADFIVLVHTKELGGTYPILFHHTMAVSSYLIGLVSNTQWRHFYRTDPLFLPQIWEYGNISVIKLIFIAAQETSIIRKLFIL